MLKRVLQRRLGSLIFPPACAFCESQIFDSPSRRAKPVSQNTETSANVCCDCERRIVGHPIDRCLKCGASVISQNPFGDRCRLCHGLDLRFGSCVAVGDYRGHLRDIVIQIKRTHDEVAAFQLGKLLFSQLERFDLAQCDLVLPVPTHWARRFKRGFHAASVIADGLCGNVLKKDSRILRCTRLTRKQGTLLTPGRFKNVRNAFSVNPRAKIAEKSILIVDDVMTSGATASEIARTLLRHGAKNVNIAVAARGAKVS